MKIGKYHFNFTANVICKESIYLYLIPTIAVYYSKECKNLVIEALWLKYAAGVEIMTEEKYKEIEEL